MGIVKGLAAAAAANRQALDDETILKKTNLPWSGRRESNPCH
jgi:hypothetical protein